MTCERIFLSQLHKRGFRLTPQRELVLFALHQIGHPATAEEIYALVAERSASVELSTIYRTLDLLGSMNLATVIDAGDKQRLFELVGSQAPHVHLVCRVCGRISGVEIDLFQPLLERFAEQDRFHADLSNLTIPGLCAECARAKAD